MSAYTPYIARVRPGGSRGTAAPGPQPPAPGEAWGEAARAQPVPVPFHAFRARKGHRGSSEARRGQGWPECPVAWPADSCQRGAGGQGCAGIPCPKPRRCVRRWARSQVASAQPAAGAPALPATSRGIARLPCCSSSRQKGFWFPALPAAASPLSETASGVLGCCEGEPVPGLGEGGQSPSGSLVPVSVRLGPSALALLSEMLMDLGCVGNHSVGWSGWSCCWKRDLSPPAPSCQAPSSAALPTPFPRRALPCSHPLPLQRWATWSPTR